MGDAGRRFVEERYDIRKLNSLLEGLYFKTIRAFNRADAVLEPPRTIPR